MALLDFHFQLLVITIIVMTLFLRTNMHHETRTDGIVYLGALFFAMVAHMFNGFSELAMATIKLPVFFKQRDYLFFPSWAYTIPTWILKIPISCFEVAITVFLSYYVIGFDPNVGRYASTEVFVCHTDWKLYIPKSKSDVKHDHYDSCISVYAMIPKSFLAITSCNTKQSYECCCCLPFFIGCSSSTCCYCWWTRWPQHCSDLLQHWAGPWLSRIHWRHLLY